MKSWSAGALALAIASGAVVFGGPATPVEARERGAGAYDASAVADFYRSRGGAPLWLSRSSGNAARDLIQLLATAQADNLNPNRYRVGNLSKAVNAASSGNPAAVQRAEMMLSQAFVAYVRDTRRDPMSASSTWTPSSSRRRRRRAPCWRPRQARLRWPIMSTRCAG